MSEENQRVVPRVEVLGNKTQEDLHADIRAQSWKTIYEKYAIESETPPELVDLVGQLTSGLAAILMRIAQESTFTALHVGDEVWYATVCAYHLGREHAGATIGEPTYEYNEQKERICGCRGCRLGRRMQALSDMEQLANAPGSERPQ